MPSYEKLFPPNWIFVHTLSLGSSSHWVLKFKLVLGSLYKFLRLSIKIQISTGFAVQTSLNNQISIALISTSKTSSERVQYLKYHKESNQPNIALNWMSVEWNIYRFGGTDWTLWRCWFNRSEAGHAHILRFFWYGGIYGYPNWPDSTAVSLQRWKWYPKSTFPFGDLLSQKFTIFARRPLYGQF